MRTALQKNYAIIIALYLLLAASSIVSAQTYLTDVYQPTEERHYKAYPTKGDGVMQIAIYKYKGGFTLGSGRGGFISANTPGYVIFDLPAGYEKMSFIVGPDAPNAATDKYNCILTIKADDRRVLDKVIWEHDAPQECVVDLKGARKLRFDILKGEANLAFGAVKLWKAGQEPLPSADPLRGIPLNDRVQLVGQLYPHFIRHSGWVHPITAKEVKGIRKTESISINRAEYKTGLEFTANQALAGNNEAWAYFWLQKKYNKVSFIIGPRDNQASAATGWLTVKGDGKILYEKHVTQLDLAEQVVLDVEGVNQLSFHSIDENSRLNGGVVFGVVNMFAYPKSYDLAMVPQAGVVNASKSKLAKLPDVCKLISNIRPYSVQGVANYENSLFTGESDFYTFSMGGETFSEGFILTPGSTLLDEHISAYWKFDLAGEFDYLTFTVGALTKRRTQSDDDIRIYCDGKLVLDTMIHVTWPNQHFTVPLNKCRTLTFAKPGTGEKKESYFGIGDAILYRGEVVENDLFQHPKPECPDSIDLIDLCQKPYYHYVGRFLSSLTNFDFNDCFQNGGSQRRYFQMPDGSRIYKGIMLETNIPFAFENITPFSALFMFITGVGGALSSSDIGAVTGTTAGAGEAAGLFGLFKNNANKKDAASLSRNGLMMGALSLFGAGDYQASACAFNPYGEYDELTFTVACRYPYVDPMRQVFEGFENPIKLITDPEGKTLKAPPVRLDVFADQVKVGEYWVYNEMKPTTVTVPINRCHQLMFWLECGEERSGQYVIYDMTVRKKKNEK